jgi:hypothetical protein
MCEYGIQITYNLFAHELIKIIMKTKTYRYILIGTLVLAQAPNSFSP